MSLGSHYTDLYFSAVLWDPDQLINRFFFCHFSLLPLPQEGRRGAKIRSMPERLLVHVIVNSLVKVMRALQREGGCAERQQTAQLHTHMYVHPHRSNIVYSRHKGYKSDLCHHEHTFSMFQFQVVVIKHCVCNVGWIFLPQIYII